MNFKNNFHSHLLKIQKRKVNPHFVSIKERKTFCNSKNLICIKIYQRTPCPPQNPQKYLSRLSLRPTFTKTPYLQSPFRLTLFLS